MASLNKAMLIGNLGRDPEVRVTPSGTTIANITIATTETWKDKQTGEKKEATEWHRVVMFDKLGEIAAEYLKKGKAVYIEGNIKTRKWTDKDGNEKYTTEIVAESMKMLGSRDSGAREDKPASESKPSSGSAFDMTDDIPF